MNLNNINSVYCVGIGGIGMSALARWFHFQKKEVAGYDRIKTTLTASLEREGIHVHYEDDTKLVPPNFKDPQTTLVVYTPAVPMTHNELSFFTEKGFFVKKRSEVLGIITRDVYSIAVAGTHGKTTISSMIAHLLNASEMGCSAFVGGIMTNYNTNVLLAGTDSPVIMEADEYDRSFMRLSPDYSILNSLDPDHLDIYQDRDSMVSTYLDFLKLNDVKGRLLIHRDPAQQLGDKLDGFQYRSFGLKNADITANNLRVEDGNNLFDYEGITAIKDLKLKLPGFHNISNAVAAITVALDMGMDSLLVKESLSTYNGVKRRFEYVYRSDELIYIDDYAHHPTEIKALLNSVRFLYPDKKVTVVFQPHLYSRTRDFSEGFSESLSLADEVVMLPIYPAREEPIQGITSQIIYDGITVRKSLMEKSDFPDVLKKLKPEVLLTVGAGDIDQLVIPIKSLYAS